MGLPREGIGCCYDEPCLQGAQSVLGPALQNQAATVPQHTQTRAVNPLRPVQSSRL